MAHCGSQGGCGLSLVPQGSLGRRCTLNIYLPKPGCGGSPSFSSPCTQAHLGGMLEAVLGCSPSPAQIPHNPISLLETMMGPFQIKLNFHVASYILWMSSPSAALQELWSGCGGRICPHFHSLPVSRAGSVRMTKLCILLLVFPCFSLVSVNFPDCYKLCFCLLVSLLRGSSVE